MIAGGSSHTNDYLKEIKNMVASDERIIMTGFIQGQELEELFSNCVIYCLPSDVEGMPISLLEAMSYGCNCLVSDIKENTQVINQYAKTFKKGNVEDLVKQLKILLEKKKVFTNAEISNYILTKYNWNNIINSLEKIYNNDKTEKVIDIRKK